LTTRKTSGKIAYVGIFTALAASLCCITPILALIAGAGGIAATFAWIEPIRPYLIGFTILLLVFAWSQKLKPELLNETDCICEEDETSSFWQSKSFLYIITLFTSLLLAFPHYAHIFYRHKHETLNVSGSNIVKHTFDVEGLTCAVCEKHIEYELDELDGILSVKGSYKSSNVVVEFDKSLVDIITIRSTINNKGYRVVDKKIKVGD